VERGKKGRRTMVPIGPRVTRILNINVLNGVYSVVCHEIAGVVVVEDPLGTFIRANARVRMYMCMHGGARQ
jgi:hypothetical protein